MKYEFDSAAIGIRIKQARQAKGWSQETLAEKADTSAQNISKFEKNGLSDMTWITNLSNILDTNLLEATIDVEGTVGEIGKEILFTLICFEGNVFFDDLVENYMYGLSENQVTNEIVKLVKIGLIVRERYTGWYDVECDRIFITAKGLITLRNSKLNDAMANTLFDELDNVVTYEQLIGEESSFGDYIKHHEAEKLIRGFDFRDGETFSSYRINYIKYLKENFETSIDTDYVCDYFFDGDDWCPSELFYHDVLHRMTFNVNNEIINNRYNQWKSYMEIVDDFLGRYDKNDDVVGLANKIFIQEFEWLEEDEYDGKESRYLRILNQKWEEILDKYHIESPMDMMMIYLDEEKLSKMDFEDEDEKDEIAFLIHSWINSQDIFDVCITPSEEMYLDAKGDKDAKLPTEWFSKEEIEKYIFENFGEAGSDYEKDIDAKLKRIWELIPESKDYFDMPKEWEENGLADLVRKNVGLNKS